MKQLQFKNAINAELSKQKLDKKVSRVTLEGCNVVLHFSSSLNIKVLAWLNNRFTNGIHLQESNNNTVWINTPFEDKVNID